MADTIDLDETRVLFSTNGSGQWWRREWKRQCRHTDFINRRCQGVEGHNGVHWHFAPDGSFCYEDNDADSTEEGCAGTTPPGHAKYRTPLEMVAHHFMSHYEDSEVTDAATIARLEKGQITVGESITRPCTQADIDRMKNH